MAPRRGGGGGGSGFGGGGVSCPSPFNYSVGNDDFETYAIAKFAADCLFFVLILGIAIAWCCARKRHGGGKKLVGPFFWLSLWFNLLAYALVITVTMLRECNTLNDPFQYYSFAIAFGIFFKLANYFLLVVVVWSLNMLLRERLKTGHAIFKAIVLVIIGIMGLLTCGYIGLSSYNSWQLSPSGGGGYRLSAGLAMEELKLATAYWILYLVSVLVAGVSAIFSLVSLTSKNVPVGKLLNLTGVVFFCMFVWNLLMVVDYASTLPDSTYLSLNAEIAIFYVSGFFTVFAYIAILCLSNSSAWPTVAHDPKQNMHHNSGYGPLLPFGTVVPPQQYAYQHQPEWTGHNRSAAANDNPHVMYTK